MDSNIFAKPRFSSPSICSLDIRTIFAISYVSRGMFRLFVRHTMKKMEKWKRALLPLTINKLIFRILRKNAAACFHSKTIWSQSYKGNLSA